jgi:hypothetical protein
LPLKACNGLVSTVKQDHRTVEETTRTGWPDAPRHVMITSVTL